MKFFPLQCLFWTQVWPRVSASFSLGCFAKLDRHRYKAPEKTFNTSWNLIPVKLLSGSKGSFWVSKFLCVYTLLLPYLLKFDSRKAAFRLERVILGIIISMCLIVFTLSFYYTSWNFIPIRLLWLKRAVLGIKCPMCIHSPCTIPLEIWFPESFFLAQKGRFGNHIWYVYTLCFYHTSWNLIPVKLLFGSKGPFWESNFLCVYILLLLYLLKFDSRKASFWLKNAVLGIKFPMCIQLPCTIPLEIWFP